MRIPSFHAPRRLAWLAVAPLLLLAACDESGQGEAAAPEPPSVTIAGVAKRDITGSVSFVGQVEAVESADIVARVEGFLESIEVPDGAFVEQGDLLFRIERNLYEANLAAAEAELAKAEAALALAELDLERSAELLRRETIAQAQYDVAVAERDSSAAQVKVAEAAIAQAQLDLDYTDIHAPFDGRIGRTAFSRGDVVGPGAGALATLVRLEPMYVAFSISEARWLSVLESQGVDIRDFNPSAPPDEETLPVSLLLPGGGRFEETGRVVFVDNRVDPATGTIALRAEFDNARARLTPGVYVTVVVEDAAATERVVVPQAAIQRDQQGDFALVVGPEGMVERRYVTLGDTVETDFIVREGLTPGESVIVEGLQRVRPGVPVQAIPVTGPVTGGEG
jgi:membrane fusion protein (multidrug efflux system)